MAQVLRHLTEPKPEYVAEWQDLPAWQRDVYTYVFESIEQRFGRPRCGEE
ncbi:hypothetical protein QRX50_29785 [Amycolatopsis carbonis]|uniref:Uncharacterized protein n=1 Tax=Amycolatopsis carbonis TaxID=715471 RepID=A0A9Y2I9P5_9PSEU|nr:hypothetical protein [Amycolatopsis sp. 2-15]WIX75677.1 hypothetical protein QRX50_29785 [Amycolatopsis sp. 2-15]